MAEHKRAKGLRIGTKFILWFLLIALVPLGIATYISYTTARRVLEREATAGLLAIADHKAYQVAVFLEEKIKSADTLSHMSDTVYAMESFSDAYKSCGIASPMYGEVEDEYRPFLTYYQKSSGFDNLFLINPAGDIVFSVEGSKRRKSLYEAALFGGSELSKAFIEAKENSKVSISDFEYSPELKRGLLYIAAPVFKGPELIGVVVLQMSNLGVYPIVQDYSNLGQTGETMIVATLDGKPVFINPLRSDPAAAFKKEISHKSKSGRIIQKCLRGQKGVGIYTHYRGRKALTVWRYLPAFRWGLIVKMDTDEIFSSARELRRMLLLISVVLFLLVTIMAVAAAHTISSPIRTLTITSSAIAGGNLSARAKVAADDEIGELADAFNRMADNLVEAKANVEQKKEELEEQKRLLEEANKELDSFVYTASHDLRAPLRGISSFASFLQEDYKDKLDKEGQDYLREIREGANRMNELIEDLLTLSRISRIRNPYEDVNINELVDSILKRIEYDIQASNVDLKVQPDMPIVRCDRIKMGEVFLNLINNAIKFSSKNNKENPKVEVGYIDEDKFYKFYVKDNGIGIDPKYRDQIFGIFKRLHNAKEYEGTGAGLSIVKRVVDDHGGSIWVESELGKGATFYFTIPKTLEKKENEKTSDIPEYKGRI